MKIYQSIDNFNSTEGALARTEVGGPGSLEADWGGMRLRGAGAPGGRHGWLVTFLVDGGKGFFTQLEERSTKGWLIAYEIIEDAKTGRLGLLRRGWNGELDAAALQRFRASEGYSLEARDTTGEYDIDVLDAELPGPVL